jgi:hypothetical protein
MPGHAKRFTVHTDIFTKRSKLFAAARKPEWVAGDAIKPVDLSDVDPDVFQAYLNCVYVGPETLEEIPGAFEREVRGGDTAGFSTLVIFNVCEDVTRENIVQRFEEFGYIKAILFDRLVKHTSERILSRFESSRMAKIAFSTVEAGEAAIKFLDGFTFHGHRLTVKASFRHLKRAEEWKERRHEIADQTYNALIKLYLLADKLQDTTTANMVMDKIEQFYKYEFVHPGNLPVSTAYQSTVEGSPLRKLLRNMWLYDTDSISEKRFGESKFPSEFLHDVLKLYMSIKNLRPKNLDSFSDITANDGLLNKDDCAIPVRCRYHQHDDEHPFCPPHWKEERHCASCRAARNA